MIQARDVSDFAAEPGIPEEPQEEDHNIFVSLRLNNLTAWSNEEENEIRFSYADDKNTSNEEAASRLDREWDWIAVVPADFAALDEWVTYAWVKGSEPRPTSGDEGPQMIEFSVRMSGYLVPGSSYRLIYFHGRVGTSVLGISEVFIVPSSD